MGYCIYREGQAEAPPAQKCGWARMLDVFLVQQGEMNGWRREQRGPRRKMRLNGVGPFWVFVRIF